MINNNSDLFLFGSTLSLTIRQLIPISANIPSTYQAIEKDEVNKSFYQVRYGKVSSKKNRTDFLKYTGSININNISTEELDIYHNLAGDALSRVIKEIKHGSTDTSITEKQAAKRSLSLGIGNCHELQTITILFLNLFRIPFLTGYFYNKIIFNNPELADGHALVFVHNSLLLHRKIQKNGGYTINSLEVESLTYSLENNFNGVFIDPWTGGCSYSHDLNSLYARAKLISQNDDGILEYYRDYDIFFEEGFPINKHLDVIKTYTNNSVCKTKKYKSLLKMSLVPLLTKSLPNNWPHIS